MSSKLQSLREKSAMTQAESRVSIRTFQLMGAGSLPGKHSLKMVAAALKVRTVTLKLHNLISYSSKIFFYLLAICKSFGQLPAESKIFQELQTADSLLFEVGFNTCNLSVMDSLMHPELQFMHDQNGVQNRDTFFREFESSICANPNGKPIRKRVMGSFSVYPLLHEGRLYGAIQMGTHEFYMEQANHKVNFTSNGRFIHSWMLQNQQWKLYRAISYNHQQPTKYPSQFEDEYPFPLFDKDVEVEALIRQLKIPSVSIGYINHGKLQQIRSFGEQIPGEAIALNSIYKVASLTKPITALLTLKLVNAGLWDLDTPLYQYFVDPELSESVYLNKLTTRNILSQKSGLPNWRYLREDKKLTFEFEPGSKFQYSGEGFEYLRKALENYFNQSIEELAKNLLFQPLRMPDSQYHWTDSTDDRRYAVESDGAGLPIAFTKYHQSNAAANLLTTVSDYSQFLIDILNGAGLEEPLFTDFTTPQTFVKPGIYWGLGMQIFPDLPNGETALVHTGGDFGTKCIAIALLRSKKGLVIFSNSENGMRIWKKIITEYLGETGTEIVRRNLE